MYEKKKIKPRGTPVQSGRQVSSASSAPCGSAAHQRRVRRRLEGVPVVPMGVTAADAAVLSDRALTDATDLAALVPVEPGARVDTVVGDGGARPRRRRTRSKKATAGTGHAILPYDMSADGVVDDLLAKYAFQVLKQGAVANNDGMFTIGNDSRFCLERLARRTQLGPGDEFEIGTGLGGPTVATTEEVSHPVIFYRPTDPAISKKKNLLPKKLAADELAITRYCVVALDRRNGSVLISADLGVDVQLLTTDELRLIGPAETYRTLTMWAEDCALLCHVQSRVTDHGSIGSVSSVAVRQVLVA